ncbi:uncharacterized protein A1O5_06834 [Cladophialophora psammophila CBS 110553]|uniref:5'-hydroxyaverantin dehydrogenase n=1 Tax=Cladophialophora psammophila CBS 110553 TaxID=1182543 RepID=W9WPD0_9EURO|nr:uncharacterized protein A1O5_06834 [Cladophialophora psammophila CBS 110553]EXJ69763.1 hypothetical protein A1O5_06834 [Cladophialophora psammophila CBS 110553]
MPLPAYANNGPVDCSIKPDTNVLKGRSVVITGGANGFGEAFTRAFAAAGAFVTFGDIDVKKGESLAAELGSNVRFVRCDITSWDDQLALFKKAVTESPAKSCDIVIANAGITGPDPVFTLEGMSGPLPRVPQPHPLTIVSDPTTEPTKPELRILQVNMIGSFYTLKLGQHYLRFAPESAQSDRCFIFMGSIAGILDQPGSFQYSASKFGLRGLMRSARRTLWQQDIRINYIAPWYTKTTILKPQVIATLISKGVEFAEIEDCTTAALRITCDRSINGRSFGIIPRSIVSEGYTDINLDDYDEGTLWQNLQSIALAASIRTMPAAKQNAH